MRRFSVQRDSVLYIIYIGREKISSLCLLSLWLIEAWALKLTQKLRNYYLPKSDILTFSKNGSATGNCENK